MRIIVTGMRDWEAGQRVWRALDVATAICSLADVTIVEGGATGADAHARAWAISHEVHRLTFHADWGKHGKPAGMIRNREMARAGADVCLAFWDGKSRGTGNMIATAIECGIPVRIWPLWFNTEEEIRWQNEQRAKVTNPGIAVPLPSVAAGAASRNAKR